MPDADDQHQQHAVAYRVDQTVVADAHSVEVRLALEFPTPVRSRIVAKRFGRCDHLALCRARQLLDSLGGRWLEFDPVARRHVGLEAQASFQRGQRNGALFPQRLARDGQVDPIL